ncbi:sarcosine oxidase subunit gamma [Antarctobacter jejuensis]|uniref:sarcosine oxidase subunit gamma n=1 Tax=Antarctobacter jejuensis TaxID=1439938 RepID=UPI003FD623AD
MSEPVQPLGGAHFEGLIDIQEIGPQGMVTLRGDLSSPDLQAAVTDLTGVAMPGQRGANTLGDSGLLWMSPDELLILTPYRQAGQAVSRLEKALAGQHMMAVNVSDARALFRLRGSQLRDVLAKVAPIDASTEALPVGELRRTRFAQAAAGVWLTDPGTAQVFCFRSVAEYMFSLLKTVAHPNSAVGYHAK